MNADPGKAIRAALLTAKRARGGPMPGANIQRTEPPELTSPPVGTKPEQNPDLFDYSRLSERPNVPQFDLPRNEPARGVPERVQDLLKSRTVQRKMLEHIHAGLGTAGAGWYNTEPLLEDFNRHLGKSKGPAAHSDFMHFVAASSPREKVPENVKKASLLYHSHVSGKGGMPAKGEQAPGEEYYPGLPLHLLNAKRYIEGAWDPRVNAKPISFAQNLSGNWKPGTIDTHAFRLPAILAQDPRFLDTAYEPTIKGPDGKPMKAPKRNIMAEVMSGQLAMKDVLPGMWQSKPNNNEYKAMEDYYKKLAAKAGVSTAQTQAGAWVGGGEKTGLASDPNKTFLHFLQDRVYKTAKETGVDPQTVLKDVITGKIPLRADGGMVDQALAITRADGGTVSPPQTPAAPFRKLNNLGFYSQAAETARALPQAKGTPQQMLSAMKGVKPEELANSGAEQAFAGQKSVHKNELANQFENAMPDIQETEHSDMTGQPTQYSAYTVPGGRNYREILMHLPASIEANAKKAAADAQLQTAMWALIEHQRQMSPNVYPENDATFRRLRREVGDAEHEQKQAAATGHDYYHDHWPDTPNVLAHLRLSDRLVDPEKARRDPDKGYALHMEELQSDWGQEGRKWSIRDPNFDLDAAQRKLAELRDRAPDIYDREGRAQRDALRTQLMAQENAVPHGPFITSTNGWTDLGLKRALLEAAHGDYDQLAWSPDKEHDKIYPGRAKASGEGDSPKGFYDKIVPIRMKEILKKLGHEAQIKQLEITHQPRHGQNASRETMKTMLHSIDMTPELKEKIKKGLPAYAAGGTVGSNTGVQYDTRQDGPFWRVARRLPAAQPGSAEGSAPEIRGPGGTPVGGGAGPLGHGGTQPPADARLAQLQEIADRHAAAHGNGPVADAGNSSSSLHKQSAIGRVFQLAATDHPGYKKAVFDAYLRHHPDLLRQSGARNYDELRAAAYDRLGHEVKSQFDDLPIEMAFHKHGEGNYASSPEMRHDVLQNGHLNVFQGGERHDFLHHIDPRTRLNENEMFRAIHDAYGHALHGSGFGAKGEERAWNAHRQMFSSLAVPAMSAETRGQNSFVNYTPINAQLLAEKHQHEAEMARAKRWNDTATYEKHDKLKKEAMDRWQYAPQKAVLLPPEMNDPKYEGGVPDYLQHLIKPGPGEGISSPITHFSHEPGLTELDPARYGTGIPGDERSRVMKRPGGVKERVYGYLGTPSSVKPEPGLGPNASTGKAHGLYDLSADPLRLALLAQELNRNSPLGNFNPGVVNQGQAMNDTERMAKEHGFSGVANPNAAYPMAALFNKTPVTPVKQDDTMQRALRLTAPGP